MDAAEWDARYADTELVWSRGPNAFVEAECSALPPGRAVDLACGEGRNAIWLASRGWDVTAVDFSQVALDKGRQLAGDPGADGAVDWVCADATAWRGEGYDLAVVAYFQVPATDRRTAVRHVVESLRPGGTLVWVGHDSTNLAEGTGGPQDPRVLMTAEDLLADLDGHPGRRRARGAGRPGRHRRGRPRRRGRADGVGLPPPAPPRLSSPR